MSSAPPFPPSVPVVPTPLDGLSLDLAAARRAQLRALLPEAFADGRLDMAQLRRALGEPDDKEVDAAPGPSEERYGLSWPGKAAAYQEAQLRTAATLHPDRAGSLDFAAGQNVFIEGENLEVLRVLQKAYFGQVKMIYIDPPYNTGSEVFVYHDDFAEAAGSFDARTGRRDAAGNLRRQEGLRPNTKDGARYHSNWLSMMLPRLVLARNLLRDDGLLFVSIDENEVASLKLLLSEVFGPENFISQFVWQRHAGGGNDSRYVATDHEYLFCFAKNLAAVPRLRVPLSLDDLASYTQQDEHFAQLGYYKTKLFYRMRPDDPRPTLQYHIPCPDGTTVFGEWKWEENEFKKAYAQNKVLVRQGRQGKWTVEYKIYQRDEASDEKMKVPRSLILDPKTRNSLGKAELTAALGAAGVFNNPKPTGLLKHLLGIGTAPGEGHLVLDFFAGSGSTAQAVRELNAEDGGNRRFICVQLAEEVAADSPARAQGYATIADISRRRIQTAVQATAAECPPEAAGLRAFRLGASNFPAWQPAVAGAKLFEQLALFGQPSGAPGPQEREAVLFELLLKSGLPLTAALDTPRTVAGTEVIVADKTLAFLLSSVDEDCAPLLKSQNITAVMCLDAIFKSDQQKTNFALDCRDNNVAFSCI